MVLRPLTDALQKVAIDELNEDPKRIEAVLQEFKLWVEQQPHLKSRTTDQFLIAFLRSCNYDLEQAKLTLDNYYAFKEKYPELLRRPNLEDPKVRKLLKCGLFLNLPKPLTETGPRICLVRNGAYDASEYTFPEVAQMRQLIQDIVFLEDDIAVIGGLIFIMDFGDVTRSHFFQVRPTNMSKLSQYAEHGVPLNIKATHFIDTPVGFEHVFNLVRSFLSENVQSKLFVHGSKREELFKIIPKELLPKEYGGDAGTMQELIDHWEQKVLSYSEYFKDEEEKYGVDETLRVKATETEESTGWMGSIRKFLW